MTGNRKLIAVVGATASRKTALGIALARDLRGEIVGADSRQVYRYMDIGTAKPTSDEQAAAPHHLIDIVDPDEPFSLATWLELATECLEDVWRRGAVPIVVGGTGQYVWALLEGWRVPRVPPQDALRTELAGRDPDELADRLRAADPEAGQYIDPRNVRRVIRALEVQAVTGKPFSYWRTRKTPDFEMLALAPAVDRSELYRRIDERVDRMFEAGLVDEARGLLERGYARTLPSMSGIGYREVCEYLAGERTLESAVEATKARTHRFVRHQNAWFKRSDKRIHWVADAGEAGRLAVGFPVGR